MENWANRKTLILGRNEMIGLLKPHEYNDCVEQAYRMHGEGRFYMDPKGHIVLDRFPGEWEAMPSYIEEPHAAACKWVSIREKNRENFNLPTVFSILIYTHPETGFPLAIVDGSYHTVMRTGVGGGRLGQVDGAQGFDASSPSSARATWPRARSPPATPSSRGRRCASGAAARRRSTISCKEQQPKYDSFEIKASTNLEQTVRGADVVVTLTPARGPIVMADWISPGTHIAAVGADKKGDQELEGRAPQARAHLRRRHPAVPHRRRDQRAALGRPDHRGRHRRRDRRGHHRPASRAGPPTRRSRSSIRPGIALQDSATVPLEYERAMAAGVGIEKKMIST